MTRGWDLRGPAKERLRVVRECRCCRSTVRIYPRRSLTCTTPRTRVLHVPDSWRRSHFAVSRLKDREYTEGYESQRHWREQKPAEGLSQDRLHRAVQALGFLRVEAQRRIAEQTADQAQGHSLGYVSDLAQYRHALSGRGGHRGSIDLVGEGFLH